MTSKKAVQRLNGCISFTHIHEGYSKFVVMGVIPTNKKP